MWARVRCAQKKRKKQKQITFFFFFLNKEGKHYWAIVVERVIHQWISDEEETCQWAKLKKKKAPWAWNNKHSNNHQPTNQPTTTSIKRKIYSKKKKRKEKKREMASTSNYLWIISLLLTAIIQVSVCVWRPEYPPSTRYNPCVVVVVVVSISSSSSSHSTYCFLLHFSLFTHFHSELILLSYCRVDCCVTFDLL